MIDDSRFGSRDKRGDWQPHDPVAYPPAPWDLHLFLKWIFKIPGYLFPWTISYVALSAVIWFYATPSIETMRTLSISWIAFLLLRNLVIVFMVYGTWHYFLYIKRTQGSRFKLNGRWPAVDNDTFLFKRQNADNLFWTLASGVPIWTAWEAFGYWMFANHHVGWIDFHHDPLVFCAVIVFVPVFHDLHFYLVHRFLHWPPMYRNVHHLHHKAVNVGPWSGLSMHPVEHLLYFSGILIHFVIPSNPFHVLFHLLATGLGPAKGHAGFDRLQLNDRHAMPLHTQMHYLHHKYFECNYGDGPLPLDKWAGTFHDGSADAKERITRRFMARAERMGLGQKSGRRA
jgi:sterol desaturase/sphingolipid hydroxylase (fatty acid hydroxylase superfamily)